MDAFFKTITCDFIFLERKFLFCFFTFITILDFIPNKIELEANSKRRKYRFFTYHTVDKKTKVKPISLLIIALFFTSPALSQASSSTEFQFEIQLPELSNHHEYEFYRLDYDGINSLSYCNYKTNIVNNSVTFSGNLRYIVGADILTFIIVQKTTQYIESYGIINTTEVVKHYVVSIGRVRLVGKEARPIVLKMDEPFVLIDAKFINGTVQVQTDYQSHTGESQYLTHNWIAIK